MCIKYVWLGGGESICQTFVCGGGANETRLNPIFVYTIFVIFWGVAFFKKIECTVGGKNMNVGCGSMTQDKINLCVKNMFFFGGESIWGGSI